MNTEVGSDVKRYIESQDSGTRLICERLQSELTAGLPEAENKVWHAHPVWFLEGNPIVGYSKLKVGVRLMFWSGADFDEPLLNERGKNFKDASIRYMAVGDINSDDLARWLEESRNIQWDYKNIVKHRGLLERLK